MKAEKLLQQLPLRSEKCTVGCPVLDSFLGGGVPCNSVTEFVAESGSGKTQICLQLVLSAQLPPSHGGLSASSFYIYTEFPFPFRRLQQLSRRFPSFSGYDPCDRVLIRGVSSADELVEAIRTIEVFILQTKHPLPVRVVVIDSIAALFRSDFENTGLDLRRRSSLFFKISGGLKSLAKRFGLAVVVTNQVVDWFGGGSSEVRIGNLRELNSSGRKVIPALGLAWSNCVNSRLFLSREDVVDADGPIKMMRRGTLSVVFAPHLPHSSRHFVIKRDGVFGVE